MTPKEKAEELVFKYDFLQAVIEGFSFYDAKECALIAVDLIIYHTEQDSSNIQLYEYYKEVKQEINKL